MWPGFCAEHTAIATAITQEGPIDIDTVVAVNQLGIIPPCGRCRELMNDIHRMDQRHESGIEEIYEILASPKKKSITETLKVKTI